MKYFINRDNGSHRQVPAGEAPDSFEEVTLVEYQKFVDDLKNADEAAKKASADLYAKKLKGFDYNGNSYSATKDDQDGLMAVFTAINNGLIDSANFEFSNGNSLVLNAQNLKDFAEKFSAFRQTFFA